MRSQLLHHIEHRALDIAIFLGIHFSEVELDAEQEVTAEDVAVYVFHIFSRDSSLKIPCLVQYVGYDKT